MTTRQNLIITMLFPVLVGFAFVELKAQPAGYYNNASGKSGQQLQLALHNIIKGHTKRTYDNLWTDFQSTDDKSNGKVWDMYSDNPGGTLPYEFTFSSDQCGTYSVEGDCYNREHSFPNAWWGGGQSATDTMYTDLFHIVPTDGKVNGYRSNYPFGEVNSPTTTTQNGSKLGPCTYSGYTGTVFEPIDAYKGDFARNELYMAVRYASKIGSWSSYANDVLAGNSYPAYDAWYITMLLEWHANDPVSQKEIDRNNAIYSIQSNRNPFIDHPEYANQIWPAYAPTSAEPTNQASGFSANSITLSWQDAIGGALPDGYLIRMSSIGFGSINNPVDGQAVTDGNSDKNVAYGVESCYFSGLSSSTVYYFKIFPYYGVGASINYKTDGIVQQISLSTP